MPEEGATGISNRQLLSEKQAESVNWSSAAEQKPKVGGINNHVAAEEERGPGEQPEPSPLRPAPEKIQGQKPLIKSCKQAMWEEVNADLCNILEMLKSITMKRLERMGELNYFEW